MMLDNEEDSVLDYSFSKKELFLMAKFLRQKQEEIPSGLESFCRALEDSIYNNMSLDEVKKFYS